MLKKYTSFYLFGALALVGCGDEITYVAEEPKEEKIVTSSNLAVKDGNVVDSEGGTAKYLDSGKYIFDAEPIFPIALSGGITSQFELTNSLTRQSYRDFISPLTHFESNLWLEDETKVDGLIENVATLFDTSGDLLLENSEHLKTKQANLFLTLLRNFDSNSYNTLYDKAKDGTLVSLENEIGEMEFADYFSQKVIEDLLTVFDSQETASSFESDVLPFLYMIRHKDSILSDYNELVNIQTPQDHAYSMIQKVVSNNLHIISKGDENVPHRDYQPFDNEEISLFLEARNQKINEILSTPESQAVITNFINDLFVNASVPVNDFKSLSIYANYIGYLYAFAYPELGDWNYTIQDSSTLNTVSFLFGLNVNEVMANNILNELKQYPNEEWSYQKAYEIHARLNEETSATEVVFVSSWDDGYTEYNETYSPDGVAPGSVVGYLKLNGITDNENVSFVLNGLHAEHFEVVYNEVDSEFELISKFGFDFENIQQYSFYGSAYYKNTLVANLGRLNLEVKDVFDFAIQSYSFEPATDLLRAHFSAPANLDNIDVSNFSGSNLIFEEVKEQRGFSRQYTLKVTNPAEVVYEIEGGSYSEVTMVNDVLFADEFNQTSGINTVLFDGFQYGLIKHTDNSIWLDRNIGAKNSCSSVPTDCTGGYYQWGRPTTDGHGVRSSPTTSSSFSDLSATTDEFVLLANWYTGDDSVRNTNISDANAGNICPIGFVVPDSSQLNSTTDPVSLALVGDSMHSYRRHENGLISSGDTHFWLSNEKTTSQARLFRLRSDGSKGTASFDPGWGMQVRCVKK